MDRGACWRFDVNRGVLCTRVTSQSPDGASKSQELAPRMWRPETVAEQIRDMCGCAAAERLPAGTKVRVYDQGGLLNYPSQPAALIVTKGHKDVLRIGRQVWQDRFDHKKESPAPDGLEVVEILERTDTDGACTSPLDEITLTATLQSLYSRGFRTVAISFLNARQGPEHELIAAKTAKAAGFTNVHLGHQMDTPEDGYLPRTLAVAHRAAQIASARAWVAKLTSSLQQFVDHVIDPTTSNLCHKAFETISFDAGVLKIGADYAGPATSGPACFGLGGPATVFDCAVLADDFTFLGLEGDTQRPSLQVFDKVAADTALSNILAERSQLLNVPYGSPIDFARCVMSRVRHLPELQIEHQIPPGAEEWLMEHIERALHNVRAAGVENAHLAFMQDGVRRRWLSWTGSAPSDHGEDVAAFADERHVAIKLHGADFVLLSAGQCEDDTETEAAVGILRTVFASLGPAAGRMVLDRIVMRTDAMFKDMLEQITTSLREISFDDGTHIRIAIRPDKEAGALTIDFTGSSMNHGSLRTSAPKTRAAVMHALRLISPAGEMMIPDVLTNCEIIIPPDSNLAAEDLTDANSDLVDHAVVTAVRTALNEQASGQGCVTKVTFTTMQNEEEPLRCEDVLGGGSGGSATAPGQSVRIGSMLSAAALDIETVERNFPIRIDENALRTGSGGDGANPGGDGLVRHITALQATEFQIASTNGMIAPFGLHGGMDGASGAVIVMRKTGTLEKLDPIDTTMLSVGDQVIIRTPGGGGFG